MINGLNSRKSVRSYLGQNSTNYFFLKVSIFTDDSQWLALFEIYGRLNAAFSRRQVHLKNNAPVLGNAIPVLGVKPKWGWYVFWLFFQIGLCSAMSFKRSRRELSIDVAEHRSMLKNYHKTHYPRFILTPKTRYSIPQNGVFCFIVYSETRI